MRTSDFDYLLPADLVAKKPPANRGDSRLLSLNGAKSAILHLSFSDFPSLLSQNDLLVFNNTRVIRARLWGKKETGGKIEILVERILDDRRILSHIKSSKSTKLNSTLNLDFGEGGPISGFQLLVESQDKGLYVLKTKDNISVLEIMEKIGRVPLPPYIDRKDNFSDADRYQTVFAKVDGAIAAPTAGLHFTKNMLEKIKRNGVRMTEITLHIGSGTFQPVRTDDIHHHVMHSERIEVGETVVKEIDLTRKQGGRVVAIGTTVARALETASMTGKIDCFSGESDLFIYPGYSFRCVDALLTNFHLPRSTLLMLVSAFAGREKILQAYQEAIAKKYRFFSYGDAMFIEQSGRDRFR